MGDFDWSDTESVVVENVDAIAVYPNPGGDIVIRQDSRLNGEDIFVVLPMSKLSSIISALQKLKD